MYPDSISEILYNSPFSSVSSSVRYPSISDSVPTHISFPIPLIIPTVSKFSVVSILSAISFLQVIVPVVKSKINKFPFRSVI